MPPGLLHVEACGRPGAGDALTLLSATDVFVTAGTERVSLWRALAMVDSGDITDGMTIIALLHALRVRS